MGQHKWSMQDAKARFNEVVEAAQDIPQVIMKNGKPAVVVMEAMEYERLRCREAASFVEVLLAMPQDDGEFPRI